MNYAWPTAEIAVMGSRSSELKKNEAADPAAKLLEKAEYAKLFANPYTAAKEVLSMRYLPQDTRRKLIKDSMLENKVSVTPIENTEYSVVVFIYRKKDC
jgi:propionyl-CoA carboxylase beta chain